MIQPMAPETIERLMTQDPPEAAAEQLAGEMYAHAFEFARSLVANHGPEGAEMFARQLMRHLARKPELAVTDDVSGSLFSIAS